MKANYLVAANVESNDLGLPDNHAYSIQGAYEIKDSKGKIKYKLISIRNPWGYDVFDGAWHDEDSRWTEDVIKQVKDFEVNLEDGLTYLEAKDVIKAFHGIWVGYYRDTFINSYLEIFDDKG